MSGGRPGFFDRFVVLHAQSSPLWLTTALMVGAFVIFALSAAILVMHVGLNQTPPTETVIGTAVFFLVFVMVFAVRWRRWQMGLKSRYVMVTEWRVGISLAAGGERIVTPYGRWGKAYDYTKARHRWFAAYHWSSIGLGLGLFALIGFQTFTGRVTPGAAAELVAVTIVLVDFVRYLAKTMLFWRASPLRVGPLMWPGIANVGLYDNPVVRGAVTVFAVFAVALFSLGLLADGLGRGESPQYVVLLFVFHGLVYVMAYSRRLRDQTFRGAGPY